jgi:hypothetical protein
MAAGKRDQRMAAAAKKARRAVVNGTEHTDASLAAMKTAEVAGLVAAIRGDGKTPPQPVTKAKAIELFRKAAEGLPKAPEVPEIEADAPGAKKAPAPDPACEGRGRPR